MRAALLPYSPNDLLFLAPLPFVGSNVAGYLLLLGRGKPFYAYLLLLVFAVGYFLLEQPEFILILTFVMLDAVLRDRRRAGGAIAHNWAVAA